MLKTPSDAANPPSAATDPSSMIKRRRIQYPWVCKNAMVRLSATILRKVKTYLKILRNNFDYDWAR
jgi:hypothetical protein